MENPTWIRKKKYVKESSGSENMIYMCICIRLVPEKYKYFFVTKTLDNILFSYKSGRRNKSCFVR
jgi:hypothetical protein